MRFATGNQYVQTVNCPDLAIKKGNNYAHLTTYDNADNFRPIDMDIKEGESCEYPKGVL